MKNTNIETLDEIMIDSLRNTNRDLQASCVKQDVTGGSTLVGVFAFIRYKRIYVLNVGDSRFLLFNTKTGEIVNTLHRRIDFEDGLDTKFNTPQPTYTQLHKVLGKIKVLHNAPTDLTALEGRANTWNPEYTKYLKMANDTPDQRGLREYKLFLNNKETNSNNSMQFVNNRSNDDELVIGRRQLPSTTRAFGDFGLFVGCDGFEESIKLLDIPKYLALPFEKFKQLLSPDHKFVSMYNSYKGNSVQWLQWAWKKFSEMDKSDPNNKFFKPFVDSARFRLKFLVQCALARLSFDNISGVLITMTLAK